MSTTYSESFKSTIVEKTVNRTREVTIDDIARENGIAHSTVGRWAREARQAGDHTSITTKEKRPQDWPIAEKLHAVIDCGSLDDEATGTYCRQKGIYAHHINQWKQDVIDADKGTSQHAAKTRLKRLKEENRQLTQELNRKEKALAEAAALVVLKKKAQQIWASDEDNYSWKTNVNSYYAG